MDLQLTHKVVLLAGGSQMVGAAIARALASEGAIPVIGDGDFDVSPPYAQGVNAGRFGSPEHAKAVVQKTIEKFGTLDALVNQVAIAPGGGLERQNTEHYVETLKCILLPCYTVTHHALPHLKRAGGSIVNVIVEAAGTVPAEYGGASAEGAVLALTREWAAELAGSGIRVNAVLPSTGTPWLPGQGPKKSSDQQERQKPVPTETGPESAGTSANEIAAMVVFLLSSRATHITGQHWYVNGGPTASR